VTQEVLQTRFVAERFAQLSYPKKCLIVNRLVKTNVCTRQYTFKYAGYERAVKQARSPEVVAHVTVMIRIRILPMLCAQVPSSPPRNSSKLTHNTIPKHIIQPRISQISHLNLRPPHPRMRPNKSHPLTTRRPSSRPLLKVLELLVPLIA